MFAVLDISKTPAKRSLVEAVGVATPARRHLGKWRIQRYRGTGPWAEPVRAIRRLAQNQSHVKEIFAKLSEWGLSTDSGLLCEEQTKPAWRRPSGRRSWRNRGGRRPRPSGISIGIRIWLRRL